MKKIHNYNNLFTKVIEDKCNTLDFCIIVSRERERKNHEYPSEDYSGTIRGS